MNAAQELKWYLVSDASLFPLREGKRARFKEYDIAVFNLGGGDFKAIDNTCPHKQGPLSDGIVAGSDVFCPLHAWKISLGTGCAHGEDGKVKTYPVKIENDKVYVAFEEGKASE